MAWSPFPAALFMVSKEVTTLYLGCGTFQAAKDAANSSPATIPLNFPIIFLPRRNHSCQSSRTLLSTTDQPQEGISVIGLQAESDGKLTTILVPANVPRPLSVIIALIGRFHPNNQD